MFSLLKNVYYKLIVKSFINKILLTNILICTITLSLLTYIISSNISDLLIKKEVKFNTQILNIVDDYYAQKQQSAMSLLKEIYMQSKSHYPVISFIRDDFNVLSYDYVKLKIAFDDYMTTGFSYDNDIRSIQIYKSCDGSCITAFRSKSPKQGVLDSKELPPLYNDSKTLGFRVFSSNPLNNSPLSAKEFTFKANITDEWLKHKIGVIMVNYDSTAIEKAYAQYRQDIKGYILILTPEGDVIFDSSGKYNGKKYPHFDAITKSEKEAKLDEVSIINTKVSDTDNVIIAGIIPEKELFSEIHKIRQSIYLISILCFIITILLTSLGTSLFSQRIKKIIAAMKKLRKGDLSSRISISRQEDELAEIAVSFNQMSSELEDYINKVYIANLRQKNAELRALQSQINPHFLYNTLESIRMRAIIDGNEDVGDMIYLLATFFRSTIKQEMIIDIKDELKYCKMYLKLFNIRYDGKLTVDFKVDENIYEYGIFKHLLQPLVENYVVHGFDCDKNNNSIFIEAFKENNDIHVYIEDNGRGIDQEKLSLIKNCLNSHKKLSNSTGLLNVHERIKMIYGDTYGLDISSQADIGTKIHIKIGAKTRKELMSYVQGIDS